MERRVLVTGAGSGIGLSSALRLAEIGFSVSGLVADPGAAAALRRAAGARRAEVGIIEADLAVPAERAGLAGDLGLWALVNNAGYMNAGRLRDVAIDEARRQLEVMVLAPIDLALQVLPGMVARGQGRIVNVTSSASHATTPFSGWYQAAKAALRELNDALRLELAGTGVDVVDIEPGAIRTGIWPRAEDELRHRRARSLRPQSYDGLLSRLERLKTRAAEPETVAEAVAEALTVGRPPRHRRVGADALPLRVLSDLVPDRLADGPIARAFRGEES